MFPLASKKPFLNEGLFLHTYLLGAVVIASLPFFLGFPIASFIALVAIHWVVAHRPSLKLPFKLYIGVLVLAFGMFGIFLTGGLGYTTRLPQRETITHVNLQRASFNPPPNFLSNPRAWALDFTDPELIDLTLAIHQVIVESEEDSYPFWGGTHFSYTLATGDVFERTFQWQPLEARRLILDYFVHPTFIEAFGIPFQLGVDQPHPVAFTYSPLSLFMPCKLIC